MKILEVTQGSGTVQKKQVCSEDFHMNAMIPNSTFSIINSAVVTVKWRIEINFHSILSSFIHMKFLTRTSHKPLSGFALSLSHQKCFQLHLDSTEIITAKKP